MDAQSSTEDSPEPPSAQASDPDNVKVASVEKIEQLLKAKDDTSRFVGLALLKSSLDTSEQLRNDANVVATLWSSISPKFLDRLLRTGSKPGAKHADARDMLDLAANVIYTFAVLLPDEGKSDPKLLGRVPVLISAVLQSSEETTGIILKILLTVVSASPDGSKAFAVVEDWSPLIEIAPKQPMVLSIITWAWTNNVPSSRTAMAARIDMAISELCASYKGTDAVTLLDFLGKLLSRLDSNLLLKPPSWLTTVVSFIHNLVAIKPTAASREAYTNCVANLLITYGEAASNMLFHGIFKSSKSLPYLFVTLILIDVRSTLPTLLEKLNAPDYPAISGRLTSALIVLSFFVNQLLQMIDHADTEDVFMDVQPDLLLKLRDSVVETMSVVMEYLRDRWDAAISGAQGLHPEARTGVAHTMSGSLRTLTWDSKHESASDDRLLLAALKALGDWLREDDAPTLRGEATGLIDILMDLYQPSSAARVGIATRPLVLGVIDGIIKEDDGIQILLEHDGWSILSNDLVLILAESARSDSIGHELGQHISAIITVLVESRSITPEDWLDVLTSVAALSVPDMSHPSISLQQLWADVLELCSLLLSKAPLGVRRRYVHSASALIGIASYICNMDLDAKVQAQITDALHFLRDPTVSSGPQ